MDVMFMWLQSEGFLHKKNFQIKAIAKGSMLSFKFDCIMMLFSGCLWGFFCDYTKLKHTMAVILTSPHVHGMLLFFALFFLSL